MSNKSPKNILFITADQWRGDCLSSLNHACVRTPNLDALAQDGVLFRSHYTQATPCGPARASLLTGLYMMNHRSVANGVPLDTRHTNIAREVRKGGYDPTLFGYTDTTPDPRDRDPNDPALRTYEGMLPGFTGGLVLTGNQAAWIADLKSKGYPIQGRKDVFLPTPNYPGAENRGHSFSPPLYTAEDSETAFITGEVLKFLSVHEDRPWFVHLSYLRPHPPLIAPPPYHDLYAPAMVPSPLRAPSVMIEATQHPGLQLLLAGQRAVGQFTEHHPDILQDVDDQEIRQLRATYYGLITQVDDQIGRLIAYLKKSGQYDNTLIIFTSDHGEMLGDHFLWGKIGYFDQAFHIPLIIRDPRNAGDAGRGRIITAFSEAVDVMPTMLSWLGLPVPAQCDGASLLPWLEGETPARWRDHAHWEYDFRDVAGSVMEQMFGLKSDYCVLNVIRGTRYKYVHFAALPPLLFDLQTDPGEFHNLAQDPAHLPLLLEYTQKLLSWRMLHDEQVLTNHQVTESGMSIRPPPQR